MVDPSTTEILEAEQAVDKTKRNFAVRVGRKVVLKLNTQQHVLVNKKSGNFLTIEPRILQAVNVRSPRQGRMDLSTERPVHILVSNVSNWEVHLPMNMKIAQTANPPIIIHAFKTVVPNTTIIATFEANINFIVSTAIV